MILEELLNKLIEKGWKPRGWNIKKILYLGKGQILFIKPNVGELPTRLRFITTKECGLWQFCVKNEMCKYIGGDRAKNYDEYANECDDCYSCDDYGYRLIESALCDEDKLEQFLLDNIKIEG